MKHIRLIITIAVVTLIALFAIIGCGNTRKTGGAPPSNTAQASSYQAKSAEGKVEVRVLDIGQGDALLIKVGDKFSMVDTGDVEHRDSIVRQLKSYGVKEIDHMILTHPDADHIGGFLAIAKNFPIRHVYDNGFPKETGTYTTYMKTVDKQNIPRSTLKKGDILDFGNGAYFEVFAPWEGEALKNDKGEVDPNENSIVGKLNFGKFSMLFTGDAGRPEENRLIKEQNTKLSSKVYKLAHHGSNKSNQKDMLRSVRPEVAVVSAGLHNDYGHPGKYTLERLVEEKIKLYRTDTMGTITIVTNGDTYSIKTER